MDTLDQTEHLTQEYLPELNLIIATWRGNPAGDQWRTPLENQHLFVKKHRVRALLLDVRELGVVDPDDSDWTNTDLVPRQIEAGVHYIANVLPKDSFAEYEMDKWNESFSLGAATVANFASTEEAMAWLKEQVNN